MEECLGVAVHVQLAGVLAGVSLLHLGELQAVVLSQPDLAVLPDQQLADREDPVTLPATCHWRYRTG